MDKRVYLSALAEELKDKHPGIRLDIQRPRLLYKRQNEDFFNIYFSNKVPDGLRIGFVLDLDIEYSSRREIFEDRLIAKQGMLESLFQVEVIRKTSDAVITKTFNKMKWLKVGRHRWYSYYLMYRVPEVQQTPIVDWVEEVAPAVEEFVMSTNILLQDVRVP